MHAILQEAGPKKKINLCNLKELLYVFLANNEYGAMGAADDFALLLACKFSVQ